jgi:glycosyltransferase involved in cell wall biosynthesis
MDETSDLPAVSVIIRACDEERVLPAALAAIHLQDYAAPIEVILVDSGSRDQTREIAARQGARVIILDRAYSPGLASNVGFDAANNPVCVLLSAGAFPANDRWLRALVDPLCKGVANVAATFSRQVPVPGASPVEDAFTERTFGPSRSAAQFSATSAAVSRDVWKLQRFEETFPPGGPDDREWFDRVLRAGFTAEYSPESVVVRSHGYSLGQWCHRVWVDAAGEQTIVSRGGSRRAPTRSPIGLAFATLVRLVRDRQHREVMRYLLLAPTLAAARWTASRGKDPTGMDWVVRPLDRIDLQIFQPRQRESAAIDRFLAHYWALERS